jgi:hypothetical protein
MGRSWIYIAFATVIILIMILSTIFLIELNTIVALGNRVENSLIGAGWTGFGEIDLEKMSERKMGLEDPETRDIFLNKSEAEKIVRDYVRDNLGLNSEYIPTDTSYIPHKINPVIIEEIKIFNPDDLPAIDNGVSITRTTIKISILVPMDIKGVGFEYVPKTVYVDIDSFK